jgi:hypothetical protein
MTSSEKRAKIASFAPVAKGRNIYSQNAVRRECVFTPYKDGRYYSDCSSFVRWLYRMADIGLKNIGGNTVGIIQNKAGVEVDCGIKNGVPTDVSALRVGDLLLFAGSDSTRAYAQYVGHVEMVYRISGGKASLVGHGSGRPSVKDMASYCKSRQAARTATRRGNKGLIRVVRFIADDAIPAPGRDALSSGMKGDDVRVMQQALLAQGFELPRYGADGEYGRETAAAVAAFQAAGGLSATGTADAETLRRILDYEIAPGAGTVAVIAALTAYVRGGPGTTYRALGVVRRGETLTRTGDDTEGWFGVRFKDQNAWISARMAEASR